MKPNNAIMYIIVNEDYDKNSNPQNNLIQSQLVFPVMNVNSYEETFEELKDKLNSEIVIDEIKESNNLDNTFTFIKVESNKYGLEYTFHQVSLFGGEDEEEYKEIIITYREEYLTMFYHRDFFGKGEFKPKEKK